MKSLNESHDHSQTSDATKHTKKCTRCGELKSLSEFHKDRNAKSGIRSSCKSCILFYVKKFHNSMTPSEYRSYRMYNSAKCRAKKKGMEFTIEMADIQVPETCPCLGIPLEITGYVQDENHKGSPNSPSLDRIDSSKGYTPDNIWVVSHRANTIMSNATPKELKLIYKALDAKLSIIEREKQMELDL